MFSIIRADKEDKIVLIPMHNQTSKLPRPYFVDFRTFNRLLFWTDCCLLFPLRCLFLLPFLSVGRYWPAVHPVWLFFAACPVQISLSNRRFLFHRGEAPSGWTVALCL